MSKDLNKKLGAMAYNGLISDPTPPEQVGGGTIRALTAKTTLVRGTILAKSSTDHKLVVLGTAAASGETLTPDCVLCDDITVGTTADEKVAVYTAGSFDPDRVTVADSYTISESDKDALRTRGIVFKAAAN